MKLKNLILTAATSIFTALSLQAAPPTVMFLPDKTWCNAHNYGTTSERNGKQRFTEDYDRAFLDSDLKNVVVQLNSLISEYGLPPKDYGSTTEIDDAEDAEEQLFEGAETGAELSGTPYEQALSKLNPDIIIYIGWDVNKIGFNYTLSYRLEAKDSYTGKSVAAVTGETPTLKSTISYGAALKNAATEHMSNFANKMQNHFDDIQENGREITLNCRILGSSDVNFNTEFGGQELHDIIQKWVSDNTVNHNFSVRNSTRNRLQFEQVRIPLKDRTGGPYQAKNFVSGLQNYLKGFGIRAENTTKGLGSGRLYIGEK